MTKEEYLQQISVVNSAVDSSLSDELISISVMGAIMLSEEEDEATTRLQRSLPTLTLRQCFSLIHRFWSVDNLYLNYVFRDD